MRYWLETSIGRRPMSGMLPRAGDLVALDKGAPRRVAGVTWEMDPGGKSMTPVVRTWSTAEERS